MNNFPLGDLPLPGPVWLFLAILLGIYLLHLIAMWILVGSLFLGINGLIKDTGDWKQSKAIRYLPIIMALVINLGVPPLLALQVLYSPQIYTSSVLVAVPWISVFILVLFAYFAIYGAKYGAKTNIQASILLGISAIAVLITSFIYSNNMSLMIRPDLWTKLYSYGSIASSEHASVGAFILKFVWRAIPVSILAFAVWKRSWWYAGAALFTAIIAYAVISTLFNSNGFNLYPNLPEVTSRWIWIIAPAFAAGAAILQRSPKWAALSAVLSIVGLIAYRSFLPISVLDNQLVQISTIVDFVLSGILLLLAFILKKEQKLTYTLLWVSVLFKGIAAVVFRHGVRVAFLDPIYPLNSIPEQSQPILIVIFLLSLVIGFSAIFWMTKNGGKELSI
ncbi:MAG: hypothetical protein ACK481_03485 [Candidatus Melainabacteria bacterium]|jgi:hypothetical protein